MVSLAILIPFLAACAKDTRTIEQKQKSYESSARSHDRFEDDWKNMGNEDMAEYHHQEADRARHNKYAAGCDRETSFFFYIFGSDACEEK